MPYGKSTFRRGYKSRFAYRRRSTKAAGYTKRRTITKAVASKLRAPTRGKRTAAGRNKSAIYTLAKQVKSLKLSQYGQYQQREDVLLFTNADTHGGFTLPSKQQPVIFQANDFSRPALFRGSVQNGVPQMTETTQAWNRKDKDPGLQDQYCWNLATNTLAVNAATGYLPLKAYYRFRFHWVNPVTANLPAVDQIYKFRIDFFTMKNGYVNSNLKDYEMPKNVGAFRNLCMSPDDQGSATMADWRYVNTSNFNPHVHRVLKTMHVTLRNPAQYLHPNEQSCYKYVACECPIRREFIKIDAYTPLEEQNLWSQMPKDRVIWCLITTNSTGAQLSSAQMRILCERTIAWRDDKGASS